MDLSFDEVGFSGWVPLFPLPGPVLLPAGLLPLHVFEPRYRAMVADALLGERLIATALLRPGYEADYEGSPAIERHVCVGRVVFDQRLDDGRYDLVLVGLRRARLLEEDRSRAYRLGRVALLAEEGLDPEDEADHARALAGFLEALPARLVRDTSRLASVLELLRGDVPAALPLGLALDVVAEALALDVPDRQRLLEVGPVADRLARLQQLLEQRAAPWRGRERPTPPWPPRFSAN